MLVLNDVWPNRLRFEAVSAMVDGLERHGIEVRFCRSVSDLASVLVRIICNAPAFLLTESWLFCIYGQGILYSEPRSSIKSSLF
jgi:hypothetical protein